MAKICDWYRDDICDCECNGLNAHCPNYSGDILLGRELSEEERCEFLSNRRAMLDHLVELQADFEDFSDKQLIEHKDIIKARINTLLSLCLETDEDNIEEVRV